MYVCGITVYDLCHIGHARYVVNYARNITDIDDKIIKRACKRKETHNQLSSAMIYEMQNDCKMLNLIPPNYEPRVTNYITEIIHMINILYEKGHAYINCDNDVMFNLNTYKNYGVFSKQVGLFLDKNNIKNYIFCKHKKNRDFVLWKHAKSNEPSWSSPWGHGRPGWHIECSAINYKFFGKNCDIHGGGSDLIFPHHENEIAQSVCAHPGAHKYHSDVIRYCLTSSHYRSQIIYTDSSLKQAYYAIKRLYLALSAMNDDFNTPKAYSVLFALARKINSFKETNIDKANKQLQQV
uniref:Cysteine--tRNA ligase, cytoplasmic n=1 Tax=Glossina austeni TaxID=7395 RepID=A0A1A9UK67_GLOAU